MSGTGTGWEIPNSKSTGNAAPTVGGTGSGWELPNAPVATPKPAGGLWGDIKAGFHETIHNPVTDYVARGAKDIVPLAQHAPGGLIHAANVSVVQPWTDFLTKGHVSEKHNAQIDKLTQAAIEQPVNDIAHPRYWDRVALDVLGAANPAASAAGRAAEAGRLAKAGDMSEALRALGTKSLPAPRLISHDGVTVKLPASSAPVNRVIQKGVDQLRQAFPNVPGFGAAHLVGKEQMRGMRYAGEVRKAPIRAFIADARSAGMFKRDKTGRVSEDALAKQHALRVVAEGVPTAQRIAFHQKMLNKGLDTARLKNPEIAQMKERDFVKGHEEQIRLNQLSQKYLTETGGTPKISPSLAHVYERMLQVAGGREQLLNEMDKLSEQTAQGRISAAGRVMKGARFTKAGELRGAEDFTGGEARIPTVPKGKQPRSIRTPPAMGAAGGVPFPKELPTLTHPYTGAAYKGGAVRSDVVRLMAESALEAERHWTLLHIGDRLRDSAKDAPTSMHDVPIVTEHLPGQPSLAAIRQKMETSPVDNRILGALSHTYEAARRRIFPEYDPGTRTPLEPIPGVKYVDERLLGGLNKANPLIGWQSHAALRGLLQVTDALNNASKIAILYLKPAYAAPNLLGNVALNIIQQGWAYPLNLRNSVKLWAGADTETAQSVLGAMGEGIGGSLHSEAGFLAGATQKLAGKWSAVVDNLPRLSAFLHEARRAGIKTPEELKQLFDPENADLLDQITRRANQEIIDYGNLGPVEQSIIRRVLFFYPWLKGASAWSVHFLSEHPTQAALTGQAGQLGVKQQVGALGNELPSWAESLVPVGTGPHGLPETVNFAGTSVLETPAEILAALGGLASGNTNSAYNVAGMLTPAANFAVETASKGIGKAASDLVANLPPIVEAERATGHRASKTFPYQEKPLTAFLQYLLGTGLVPRETNPDELRAGFQAEHRKRH